MATSKFYFRNNYLLLRAPERFIFRLVSYLSYASLASLAVILFLSEKQALNSLALITSLFLIDRFLVLGRSKKNLTKVLVKEDFQIAKARQKGSENISNFLNPKTTKLLESAQTRTLLLGGELYLHLFLLLLRQTKIQKAFSRLEVNPDQII